MICYLLLVSCRQTSCGNFQGHDHQNEGAVLKGSAIRIGMSHGRRKKNHQSKENANQAKKDTRLFDGSAIAQEADDEDESPSRNQQIGTLGDHLWLDQVLL